MQLTTHDIEALRTRLKAIEGGIRAVAIQAGLTERVAHKLLSGDNVRQQTYDAFMLGLEQLEELNQKQRQFNSLRAQGRPSLTLA